MTRAALAAAPGTNPPYPAIRRAPALAFAVLILVASLFLQRFGVIGGGKSINVVGPIGLAAAAFGLLQGWLSLAPIRLAAFLALCLVALLGMAFHQIEPGTFALAPSLPSIAQFLSLSAFATLTFTHPVSERSFFRAVTGTLAIIAAAGIVQFALQFVGIRLFAFRGIVPDAFLFEDGFNLQIPIGFGGLFKANGLFMVEPSVFSQFMALAMIVEIVTFRRIGRLALFSAGLLLSVSGTGWIVIASFMLSVVFSMGARGVVVAFSTFGLLGLLVGGLSVLAPDIATGIFSRLDEIVRPQTSGHLRFITPFWLLDDVMRLDPMAMLLGVGGGVSERLTIPYDYTVNTPVKIAIEYGAPALLAYLWLLAAGRKSPAQRALVVPGLVLLMFAGGYQQFAPVLFPVLLMMSVARLQPDLATPDPAVPDRVARHARPATAAL